MRNLKVTGRDGRARPIGASARRASVTLGLALCGVVGPALAQDLPDGDGVRIGQTRLFPELRLDYIAHDNVYRAGRDETEASALELSPLVRWQADRRLLDLEARYDGRYSAGSEDILDFAEHRLGLTADAAPSSRTRLDAYASVSRVGEERRLTSADADGVASERVDVDRFAVGAALGYGASGARGNLRFGLDVSGYDPDLEPDQTRFIVNRRQFTRIEPSVRFSLRVSPDTRWLLEARFTDIGRRDGQGADNRRVSLLTGLGFATSGAFGGDFRVGVTRISYEDDVRDDDNTARVAAGLFYAPTTFSRFDLTLARDFDPRLGDSDLGTESAISTSADLRWRYAYSERVSHRASLFLENNEIGCPSAGDREVDVGFELNLSVRRWIEIGASVAHEIDRIEDVSRIEGCAEGDRFVDPALLETEATRFGVHVRAII